MFSCMHVIETMNMDTDMKMDKLNVITCVSVTHWTLRLFMVRYQDENLTELILCEPNYTKFLLFIDS